jgi:hypothetical protein
MADETTPPPDAPPAAGAPPAPGKPAAPRYTADTDARPYDEATWQRGQEVYFKLLDIEAGRAKADPRVFDEARGWCRDAEALLREKAVDYDDFVERVWLSEKFYSDASRMKKAETYLKQLFLRKNRIEQILRTLAK